MRQATLVWSLWQRLLHPFASAFTRPGHRRLVEWVTASALDVEEHTITQSVIAIERTDDWKAMESFAEYGARKAEAVTRGLSRPIDDAPGRTWHGSRVSAVDDTKVHRSGEHAWGTRTFHEYTARCPNRATTVRAHNRVRLGALLRNDGKPAWYLPVSGRLYFRIACPRWDARTGSGARRRSGARSWPRPARVADGRDLGGRARRSSMVGCGRFATRRSPARGGCSGMT